MKILMSVEVDARLAVLVALLIGIAGLSSTGDGGSLYAAMAMTAGLASHHVPGGGGHAPRA